MKKTICTALGLTLVLATGAAAQDYTSEELIELFSKQKAAVSEAESGLGQTRGLKLVTQDTVADTAGATISGEEAVVSSPAGEISATGTATAQLVSLPAEAQINMRISFDYDSAALKPSEQAKLTPMCDAIRTSDVEVLRIVGHTDAAGSEDYNQRLSRLRAEEVARHLVSVCGIAPERLQTMGLGERFPLNEDNPRADENRRVEFQALS